MPATLEAPRSALGTTTSRGSRHSGSVDSLSAHFSGAELELYRRLFNGARAGDVDTVASMLQQGVEVNCIGPRGATPLHIAARFGQLAVVDVLLEHGADAMARDHRGHTPANKAQSVGESAVVQRLAAAQVQAAVRAQAAMDEAQATITKPNFGTRSSGSIHRSSQSGRGDPRCRKLFEAAHSGNVTALTDMLASAPEIASMVGPRGATALHVAARYGHTQAVGVLLAAHADVHVRDEQGNTPADKARAFNHPAVTALLVAAEAERPKPPGSADGVKADLNRTTKLVDSRDFLPRPPLPPTAAEERGEVVLWSEKTFGAEGDAGGAAVETALVAVASPWKPEEQAAWLVGTSGAATDVAASLRRGVATFESPLTVGRSPNSGLRLQDAEVSGQHAAFWFEGSTVMVADKPGSFNGTYLRLSTEKVASEPCQLQPGDSLLIGGMHITLVAPESHGGVETLAVRSAKDARAAPEIHPLTSDKATIGRAPRNNIVLNDQMVSSFHAELLRRTGGGWAARDLGSSNGTCLRLSPERQPSRPFPIRLDQSVIISSGAKSCELHLMKRLASAAAIRGRRGTMEDAHLVMQQLPPPPNAQSSSWPELAVFAVYDGHAGAEASEFARRRLHNHLAERLAELMAADGAEGMDGCRPACLAASSLPTAPEPARALETDRAPLLPHPAALFLGCAATPPGLGACRRVACATGDSEMSKRSSGCAPLGLLCRALRDAFIKTDDEFCHKTAHLSGSTAVVVVCTGTHLVVGNAGDSRAYVWREGRALELSVDHKPDRPDEHARICEAGGFVARGRVLHSLAVSRALGDREYKQIVAGEDGGLHFKAPLVTADPEVRVCRVAVGDELLLACDGLWEVMTAETAFNYLHSAGVALKPQRAVRQLVVAAEEEYKSTDNVTAVYVRL